MADFYQLMTDMSESGQPLASYSDHSSESREELRSSIAARRALPGVTRLTWEYQTIDPSRLPDWIGLLPDMIAISSRMKDLLDARRAEADQLGWITAEIELPTRARVERWIPLFGGDPDVLDAEATHWGRSGLPIRWYLAASKVSGRRAFSLPGRTSHMIVSSEILTALREQGMTGFTAQPARMTER